MIFCVTLHLKSSGSQCCRLTYSVNSTGIMAFTQTELFELSECLKEIVEEKYCTVLHELRKKLSAICSKQQEFNSKISRYAKDIQEFNKCHQCHSLITERRSCGTQTDENDFIEVREHSNKIRLTITNSNSNKSCEKQTSNGISYPPDQEKSGQDHAATNDDMTMTCDIGQELAPSIEPKLETLPSAEPVAGPSGLNRSGLSMPPDIECICIDSD